MTQAAAKPSAYLFTPYAVVKTLPATEYRGTRIAVTGYDPQNNPVAKTKVHWDYSQTYGEQVTRLVNEALASIGAASEFYLVVELKDVRIFIPAAFPETAK